MNKPFDLQKALAGHPCETRHGRKVIRLAHFPEANGCCRLQVLLDGNDHPVSFFDNGECGNAYYPNEDALRLSSEKKQGWINLYQNQDSVGKIPDEWKEMRNTLCTGYDIYASEEAAKNNSYRAIATIKIEWEE